LCMNRARALLLTAYLVLVIVGGVIYVQSVSNMVLYTEADQKFPSSIFVNEVRIPRYAGARDYSINCSFRFENPSRVPIRLRAFSFEIAIDDGSQGNPYDVVRLASEKIGEPAESLGDAGPLIDPGGKLIRTYAMRVPAADSSLLDHLNANGNYTVILYSLAVSYSYSGTSLLRQFWPGIMTVEVAPIA
jgi:hypothetical protein